jgi:octaprenyl-diphosphate synthase
MADLENIIQPVKAQLVHTQSLYDKILSHEDDLLGTILAHVRARRGKMMRPILVLLSAMEAGDINAVTYDVALSLELFHNASLLHDDVVDESNERRGKKSVNAQYGNKLAVLVGDYILSLALKQSVKTRKMHIVNRISELGILLSEGEVNQQASIRNEGVSMDDYYRIIKHKTAELFSACGELGAYSAGASDDAVATAKRLGEIIGMCFQIRDDIFDYYHDDAIGKPTGNDMLEGKLTLPVIYALNSNADPKAHANAAKVKGGTATQEDIQWLIEFAKTNGGIDYAYSVMDDYRTEARQILSAYTNVPVREALQQYVDFVIDRNK